MIDMVTIICNTTMVAFAKMAPKGTDAVVATEALRSVIKEGHDELVAAVKAAIDADVSEMWTNAVFNIECQSLALKALKRMNA